MADFKTTHVGSLPRPQEMMGKSLHKQEITRDDLKRYLADILDKQLSLGLTYINNGELPRPDYVNSTVSRISGFGGTGIAPIPRDLEELPDFSRRFSGRNGLITLNPKAPIKLPACSAPLSYIGEASLREELEMMAGVFRELEQRYPDVHTGLFFTSPSPGTVALFMENQYFPNYEAYLENIAAVLKKEYDIIASYGFQLQIDCPDLAMGRHTRFSRQTDTEFLAITDTHVHALNQALTSVDADKCRAHICWGNYAGTHHCDMDFKKIFHQVMNVNARFISIEASNHRHAHEWTVFEEFRLPEDKVLMPGVIDTSSTIVEHPDLVAQRLTAFANLLGPDRVIGSTDCGFATTASAANVPGEVAWLKLASLVEGARRAGRRFD
ncbi:MAG: cobalamin-independent methionine synthase II family protein [Deltaproteobacteria bacterium]|nr:cobalamin-independent methionine synthase II family protein [Deltaproteobacteria bacterium]